MTLHTYGIVLPHLSMIHLKLDEKGLPKASSGIARVAADHLRGKPEGLTGYFDRVRAKGTYLFWHTARTAGLDRLHVACVQAFAGLRAQKIQVSWPMNKVQQAMHRRYGYPSVMDAFEPHLTLHVLGKEHANHEGGIVRQPWAATELALVRIGRFGSAVEVLARAGLVRGKN